ncbi:MAG: hypothetical protein V9G19_12360 [Tetrasphaera sp.]
MRSANQFSRGLAAAVPFTLLIAGVISAPPAQAAAYVVDRDHIDTSQTRATGHVEFAGGGMHVWTRGTTSTDKAAGYFDVVVPLAGVVSGSGEAGLNLRIDIDGDGSYDGTLVYESIYNGTWWLTEGWSAAMRAKAPYIAPGGGNNDGQGSPYYGSLAEWRAAFPAGAIVQAGWVLGVPAVNTLHAIKLGETTYDLGNRVSADLTVSTRTNASNVTFLVVRVNA